MRPTRVFGCCVAVMAVLAFALAIYDPWPARDAMDAARTRATAQGWVVGNGGFADFIAEPDRLGGCEVRVVFDSVEMRVCRSWRFGAWHVIEIRNAPGHD